MRNGFALLLGLLFLGACTEADRLSGPAAPAPDLALQAAADAGSGFHWLPPLAPKPGATGTFDADLAPEIRICRLAGGACAEVIATFTMQDGAGSETVRVSVEDEHYRVNWHTGRHRLSVESRYRITVLAGPGVVLGELDVQPVQPPGQTPAEGADGAVVLVNGSTVPIKFRIETGIPGAVRVDPAEATIGVAGTQPFTATVTDLHGDALDVPVVWSGSDDDVATVNASGLATGVAPGAVSITASAGSARGSATLTVEGEAESVALAAISAGGAHTCALTTTGEAYCWGNGGNGRLGDGETESRLTPVAVAGAHAFSHISAGGSYTCAVTTEGAGYCWGLNGSRFGNGSSPSSPVPVPVSGGHVFSLIEVGSNHTCGVTTADVAYCWGFTTLGRLGNGSSGAAAVYTPTPVSGGHRFTGLEASSNHSCAVRTDGAAYCWGPGSSGALGDGAQTSRSVPVAVLGGLTFTAVTVGPQHSCGLTPTGQAYCWGAGSRLGNGDGTRQLQPVAVSGAHTFAAISAGSSHTCGITVEGEAYCWGLGTFGQLGNGGTDNALEPVPVAGGHTFAAISGGDTHTCALTPAGDAYCWGDGGDGRLGNGGTDNALEPVRIAPLP